MQQLWQFSYKKQKIIDKLGETIDNLNSERKPVFQTCRNTIVAPLAFLSAKPDTYISQKSARLENQLKNYEKRTDFQAVRYIVEYKFLGVNPKFRSDIIS